VAVTVFTALSPEYSKVNGLTKKLLPKPIRWFILEGYGEISSVMRGKIVTQNRPAGTMYPYAPDYMTPGEARVRYTTRRLFHRIIPALIVSILLLNAFVMFTLKYNTHGAEIPMLINQDAALNRIIFLRNFYISFAIYGTALFGYIFFSAYSLRCICLVAGFAAAILSVYVLNDFFTVNIFIYLSYAAILSIMFPPPKCFIVSICGILFFLLFMNHPRFMGLSLGGIEFTSPSFLETYTMLIILLFASILMGLLRYFMDKYLHDQETIKHLDFVSTKLVLFNHRLQKLAKQRGEEAVKQERLRFTRDLHDSCGYAFSNIILVTDAAVSRGEMEAANSQEIFHQIRGLASRGLNDTRETLHLIRQIQEPYHRSVETIHQLKKIFEEITGILVNVEWGNMKHDYGPVINKVLTRIIQEAFTNSIRHGKASRILIHFWEFPGEFTMTVTDNGIGSTNIVKGIGLAGMEERLESAGGTLDVSSPPEGGFRLKITIPLVNIAKHHNSKE
jgi:signal transduction histidine kinase